ncbi:MAG: hypothetical protein Q9166_002763 [cf. Caloplaca sp. 2 TL-2023]
MPKRSIADFFKPFANPRNTQSPLDADDSRSFQHSISTTQQPKIQTVTEQAHAAKVTPITSSQSSFLSSLQDSTPSAPDESRNLPREPSTTNLVLAQSFGEDLIGSQTTVIPSSQRIVRNGEVIIKDSDDERSDSDISLEDLDDLIARRKAPLGSSASSQHELPSLPPSSAIPSTDTRFGKRSKRTSKDQSSTATELPTYKFSLDALIRQRQKYEDSRASIQDARQLLESFDERKSVGKDSSNRRLDKDLLASMVNKDDDETDMGRLMAAIERTEALRQEETWSFFGEDLEGVDIEPADCPSVVDQHWQGVFEGSSSLLSDEECMADALTRPSHPPASIP